MKKQKNIGVVCAVGVIHNLFDFLYEHLFKSSDSLNRKTIHKNVWLLPSQTGKLNNNHILYILMALSLLDVYTATYIGRDGRISWSSRAVK